MNTRYLKIGQQLKIRLQLFLLVSLLSLSVGALENWKVHNTSDGSTPTGRHEAAGVVINKTLYLIGGRGLRPLEALNTVTNKWAVSAISNFEINHFQPVVWGGKIYAIGAFTGAFPNETNVPVIKIFDTETNTWSDGADIPVARRRGSAGAAVYKNKIYILGGNTNGHDGGAVPWFDEYDPATNQWRILADSPNARDHFGASVIGNKFIAAGGRRTQIPAFLGNKVSKVDLYNFSTEQWETTMNDIPTPRAGTATLTYFNEVIVIGGEASAGNAEDAVEALNVYTGQWRMLPPLGTTRHGMGAGIVDDILYIVSGNEVAGGGQELATSETLNLKSNSNQNQDTDGDGLTDSEENNTHLTDPTKSDTDGDTLSDGIEVNTYFTNPLQTDSDADGLSDGDEVNFYSTNPLNGDTDGDGLGDNEEINSHNTDPTKADTDDDSLNDSEEVTLHGTNPLKADSDDDELSDADEINIHNTDPQKLDTDDDSLKDSDEVNIYKTDPLKADSDDDTLSDEVEINQYNSDPNKKDTDDDGLSDDREVELGTNLSNADTDGDGYDDGVEITENTDPNDADDPGVPAETTATTDEKVSSGALSYRLSFLFLIIGLGRIYFRKTAPIPIQ